MKYTQKHLIHIKQKVLLNQYLKMRDFERKHLFIYVYDVQKNISEEKFYSVVNTNVNTKPDENDLYRKTD